MHDTHLVRYNSFLGNPFSIGVALNPSLWIPPPVLRSSSRFPPSPSASPFLLGQNDAHPRPHVPVLSLLRRRPGLGLGRLARRCYPGQLLRSPAGEGISPPPRPRRAFPIATREATRSSSCEPEGFWISEPSDQHGGSAGLTLPSPVARSLPSRAELPCVLPLLASGR